MSEWKEYKLGELVQTNKRSINSDYPYEEIAYLDTGSITRGKIDSFQKYKLNEAPSRAKRLVVQDDIIYSTVRPIQKHYGFIDNPLSNLVVSTGFATITCEKDKLNPKFLYYLLTNDETVEYLDVIAEASTSAYPSLRPSDIENLEITIPELPLQKSIASILSILDDKIELLHRQNSTLEKMAETLFRQWFVEEAKEEWKMGKIQDLIDFNPQRSLKKGMFAPFLEMSELDTQIYAPANWYEREFLSGTKFTNGDTLLARITPCLENGKTAYVDFLDKNQIGWGSTEFIIMRPKSNIHTFLAYVIARYKDFRDYAEGCMSGSSGRQRVDLDNLKNYEIRIPSNEVILNFNNQMSSIVPKLNKNSSQIRTLNALRDTLLPKLMRGEVRVEI